MNAHYPATSQHARCALAIAAMLVTLLGAAGIDGLAAGYHGVQGTQAKAPVPLQKV